MNSALNRMAIFVLAASVVTPAFAQNNGADIYKAKCAMCHGATGTPSPAMAKAMGIKPVSDPSMKALTIAQIEATVKNGHGKMKPIAGLSDAQVSAVAAYFKTLK